MLKFIFVSDSFRSFFYISDKFLFSSFYEYICISVADLLIKKGWNETPLTSLTPHMFVPDEFGSSSPIGHCLQRDIARDLMRNVLLINRSNLNKQTSNLN